MNPRTLLVAALLTCGAATIAGAMPAQAAVITVNTTSMAVANDGHCSLIEAINAANTDTASGALPGECSAGSGADTVVLPNATYTLSAVYNNTWKSGLPPVTSVMTVQGNGSITQRATNAPWFRLWVVGSGGDLTLNDVTVRGGLVFASNGGGIWVNDGALHVNRSTIETSVAEGGRGGGVFVSGGTLAMADVILRENRPSAAGGANATLTMSNALVTTNDGHGIELSGAISLTVTASDVLANQRDGVNGALLQSGVVAIADSQIENNRDWGINLINCQANIQNSVIGGSEREAGLNLVSCTTTITNTVISNNARRGILTIGGSLQLRSSMVVNNAAPTSFPGGIDARDAAVEILRTTLANNTPNNVSHSAQPLRIVNSTLSGVGEQLRVQDANVEIIHSTLVVSASTTPAILAMSGVITSKNSIVDRCYRGPFGPTFVSQGYNIDRSNQCGFTSSGDIQNLDPDTILAPLANNGGPTLTRALLPGAAAIDAIPVGANSCQPGVSLDQRQLPRANGPGRGGSACDIGAFEVQGTVSHRMLLPAIRKR